MSQSLLEAFGGGSHEKQEALPSVRRENAERCLNQSAIKYTPKISADACPIQDLFPSGTLSIDSRSPAPSFDLPYAEAGPFFVRFGSVCSSSSEELLGRSQANDWGKIGANGFVAFTKIQRALRGIFVRTPQGNGKLRFDVGARFWRLPVGVFPYDFKLDIPKLLSLSVAPDPMPTWARLMDTLAEAAWAHLLCGQYFCGQAVVVGRHICVFLSCQPSLPPMERVVCAAGFCSLSLCITFRIGPFALYGSRSCCISSLRSGATLLAVIWLTTARSRAPSTIPSFGASL